MDLPIRVYGAYYIELLAPRIAHGREHSDAGLERFDAQAKAPGDLQGTFGVPDHGLEIGRRRVSQKAPGD